MFAFVRQALADGQARAAPKYAPSKLPAKTQELVSLLFDHGTRRHVSASVAI